jgi:hypothetical protein
MSTKQALNSKNELLGYGTARNVKQHSKQCFLHGPYKEHI